MAGPDANQFMHGAGAQNIGENTMSIWNRLRMCLMDILDAIVKCCDRPVKYSIEDYRRFQRRSGQ
jgi:hypothetical protein